MPLIHSSSKAALKTNMRTLMNDIGKSPHVQSRKQAIAIALSTQRRGKAEGGGVDEVLTAMENAAKRRKQDFYIPKKAGAGAISPNIQTPWYARSAVYGMRSAAKKGPLVGTSPGRTDVRPTNVSSGSYVVPADVVSALGQGNTLAGHKQIGKMFSGAKMQKYGGGKFRISRKGSPTGMAEGGSAEVPIIAADGEHILSPEEVNWYGKGDMKAGHNALDRWVLGVRQKNIKDLKRLKPPKKD